MLKVYLNKNLVFINPPVKNRKELFEFLGKKVKGEGYIKNEEKFSMALEKREQKSSNVIRTDIAMPHTRLDEITHQFVAVCVFTNGLQYSEDENDELIRIVFCVGSRKEEPSYLALCADISLLLMKEDFRNALKTAHVPEDVLLTVSNHSIEEYTIQNKQTSKYKVVLVLNEKVDEELLLELLLESRLSNIIELTGENFLKKNIRKIPFVVGVRRAMKKETISSRILLAVTDDKEVVNKLYLLLKKQGIDLNTPGVGVLYITEILACFGGIEEELDF